MRHLMVRYKFLVFGVYKSLCLYNTQIKNITTNIIIDIVHVSNAQFYRYKSIYESNYTQLNAIYIKCESYILCHINIKSIKIIKSKLLRIIKENINNNRKFDHHRHCHLVYYCACHRLMGHKGSYHGSMLIKISSKISNTWEGILIR